MIAWSTLTSAFKRADDRDDRERVERARRVGHDERSLWQHAPQVWGSVSERKRLVAYWAFLRWAGCMQRQTRRDVDQEREGRDE